MPFQYSIVNTAILTFCICHTPETKKKRIQFSTLKWFTYSTGQEQKSSIADPTIWKLQGNSTMFFVCWDVLIPLWRSFCSSAFFRAPVFFFGIAGVKEALTMQDKTWIYEDKTWIYEDKQTSCEFLRKLWEHVEKLFDLFWFQAPANHI